MGARIIPGFLNPNGGTALLVVDGKRRLPRVEVKAASARVAVRAEATLLRSGTPFDQELATRGVWTFRIEFAAPIQGPLLGVEAAVDGVPALCTIPVVPSALPSEGMTVAAATCFYDYFPTNGSTSYRHQLVFGRWFGRPKLKILAGDNLYIDVAPGQLFSKGAYKETAKYYCRYFAESAYAEFLAGEATVTTWDDHEFWNNYPEEQAHLSRTRGADRQTYMAAGKAGLDLFQAPLNPAPIVPLGRSYTFDILPLSFFVADVRTERTLQDRADRRFMPDAELLALVTWLRTLRNPGVLVLGQPLWTGPGNRNDWNLPAFDRQYGLLWGALADAPYDVLVLSGDVHYSRAIEITAGRGNVFEVISSPAVHIPSIATSALSSLGVRAERQDRASFSLRGSVEVDPRYGVKPRLSRLLFGHDSPNSFALLHFRGSADRVDVGLTFVDHQKGVAAPCTRTDAASSLCHAPTAFALRRRSA